MTVAAIVLAAGTARRFGATKQLAELEGRPLVAHAVEAAVTSGCSPVVVVVGHRADEVAAAVARQQIVVVHNDAYRSGQASSLRAGLASLSPDVEATAVLLGDEPDMDPAVIDACVRTWRSGGSVVRARYDDGLGHPVVFDRSVWPRLRELRGDIGARAMVRDMDGVRECRVDGPRPPDVDVSTHLLEIEHDRSERRRSDGRTGTA